MPRANKVKNPSHDPALVEFFQGSTNSYESDVDDLIQKLDEAATYTRAERAAQKSAPDFTVVKEDTGVITIQLKGSFSKGHNPELVQMVTQAIQAATRETPRKPVRKQPTEKMAS